VPIVSVIASTEVGISQLVKATVLDVSLSRRFKAVK
jgi:hypothetical protein